MEEMLLTPFALGKFWSSMLNYCFDEVLLIINTQCCTIDYVKLRHVFICFVVLTC